MILEGNMCIATVGRSNCVILLSVYFYMYVVYQTASVKLIIISILKHRSKTFSQGKISIFCLKFKQSDDECFRPMNVECFS